LSYPCAHRRHPPPFPTRRSSDLPTSSSGPSGTAAGGSPGAAPKAPAATAQILSRSLAGARRSGITVAFSVNQAVAGRFAVMIDRSEEHTSELQSRSDLVCRLLLE